MRLNSATPKNDAINFNIEESNAKRPKFKKESAIALFLIRGDSGVCEPQVYENYRETCLHTTVSTFEKMHGMKFNRKYDPATKYRRPFMRYWLADKSSIKIAFNLLNQLRVKRNVKPIDDCCLVLFYGDK